MIGTLLHLFRRASCGGFTRDTRAISFNVGYIINVGITAVVIIGLITGVGTVLDSQQDRAVKHQAEVIGDQVAGAVMATDRLGSVGDGTDAVVTRNLPNEVVGTPYKIRLVELPSGPHVMVDALGGQYVATVPLQTDADIKQTAVPGRSKLEIVHEYNHSTDERTLWIRPAGDNAIGADTRTTIEVEILSAQPDPAEGGDTLEVQAEITNAGSEGGFEDIRLEVWGDQRDSTTVALSEGESTTVTLYVDPVQDDDFSSGMMLVEVKSEDGDDWVIISEDN